MIIMEYLFILAKLSILNRHQKKYYWLLNTNLILELLGISRCQRVVGDG